MFGLGTPELILILVVALIVFGPKKLPEMGRAIGRAMKEFRKGTQELTEELGKIETGDEKSREDLASLREEKPKETTTSTEEEKKDKPAG